MHGMYNDQPHEKLIEKGILINVTGGIRTKCSELVFHAKTLSQVT